VKLKVVLICFDQRSKPPSVSHSFFNTIYKKQFSKTIFKLSQEGTGGKDLRFKCGKRWLSHLRALLIKSVEGSRTKLQNSHLTSLSKNEGEGGEKEREREERESDFKKEVGVWERVKWKRDIIMGRKRVVWKRVRDHIRVGEGHKEVK
jgi:hypothetical protein